MKASYASNRTPIYLVLPTLALLLAVACSSQEDPFDIQERLTTRAFTPTAVPTVSAPPPAAAPAPAAAPTQASSPAASPPTQTQPTAIPSSSGSSGQTSAPTPTPIPATAPTPTPASPPTPVPTLEPTATATTLEARQVDFLASLFEPSLGAIKLAESSDKPVQFENALLGYIIVYGYDFSVELVPTEGAAYQEAFQKGELDVILELDIDTDRDWYSTHIDGKAITDLGSIRDGNGNIRLIVHSGMWERAPEIVEFLGKAKPTDELIDKLSSTIKGGRIGIKPMVPAIKFLKEQEAIWTQWVPAPVADKVKAAMAARKTSLVNRKCIPDGGSGGGDSSNCGT